MKALADFFGKIFDSSIGHLFVLSLGVAAFFLLFKGTASYLPNGGLGGALKKGANAI